MADVRYLLAICGLALLPGGMIALGGCAYGREELEPTVPEVVIDFVATYEAPIEDRFHYYIAIDAGGDEGLTGPVPVAAGPNWGNGWGTGSLTHYVEYQGGRYELFRATFEPELEEAGGGITSVSGVPDSTAAGVHTITIDDLEFGEATVTGDGAIVSVVNHGFQAAGAMTIATDAAGEVIPDSVTWTPSPAGGRPLTGAELAQINALNAGGVVLAEDSLDALGLTLTLSTEPDLSGEQTIEVAQTFARVTDRFEFEEDGPDIVRETRLPANNDDVLDEGPIPGMTIVTGDLVVGERAQILLLPSGTGESIGFPYESTLPNGGRSLRVTLDLAQLGEDVPNLSVNFISTTELIFSATVVNPDDNTYDALGPWGNDYITFDTDEFQTIRNGDFVPEEGADDPSLVGPATEEEQAAVDLVDWSVTVRRLR